MPSDILPLVESPPSDAPVLAEDFADLVPAGDLLNLSVAEALPAVLQLAAQPTEESPVPSPEAPLVGPQPQAAVPATDVAVAAQQQAGGAAAGPAFPFSGGRFWTGWTTVHTFEPQSAYRPKSSRKRAGVLDDAAVETDDHAVAEPRAVVLRPLHLCGCR